MVSCLQTFCQTISNFPDTKVKLEKLSGHETSSRKDYSPAFGKSNTGNGMFQIKSKISPFVHTGKQWRGQPNFTRKIESSHRLKFLHVVSVIKHVRQGTGYPDSCQVGWLTGPIFHIPRQWLPLTCQYTRRDILAAMIQEVCW